MPDIILNHLPAIATPERLLRLLQSVLILTTGFLLGRIGGRIAARLIRANLGDSVAQLARRGIFWLAGGLSILAALDNLGIDMRVLLGAAGVLTVALGFASQTSVSNIISGLFLMVERPFVVGDTIRIGDTQGEVLSIDLLSVKLRTFDNLFVRIPSEMMIKTPLTNLTHFPLRRLDLQIGVSYKEDVPAVRKALQTVAEHNPLCLEDPQPLFIFLGFGDSALNLQFSVWAKRENFLELRNTLQQEIKAEFDRQGIEIPFPQRTLHFAGPPEFPAADKA